MWMLCWPVFLARVLVRQVWWKRARWILFEQQQAQLPFALIWGQAAEKLVLVEALLLALRLLPPQLGQRRLCV
jgi:hypothetical protein